MKLFSLLKAVLTQDMNIFNYNFGKHKGKIGRILLPIVLFLLVAFSVGFYAANMADPLKKVNLTYVMLTMFMLITIIVSFFEIIYKSQGMLFESKDNDLLFSLPIKKSTILFIRLLKLLLFEYLFNLIFLLPAYVVYIIYETPGISFYLISILMYLLVPIIPTILACIIGYLVKMFSSKGKYKKIIQTILTSIIFMIIFFASFYIDKFFLDIAEHATSINDFITKLYYPIGLYIDLILKFDILKLLILLIINIVPFIIFIIIGQKFYFRIISNSKSSIKRKHEKLDENKIKTTSVLKSLTKKELKRYFSSPVYMFNTSFGLILIPVLTISMCIKGPDIINTLAGGDVDLSNISIELLYYLVVLFSLLMTSITSSSISLEGKTINYTKSLPIDYKTILLSKIMNCYVLELPFVLVSLIPFIIIFTPSVLFVIELIIMAVLIILIQAVIGLLANLKYPKLNASNDTEVVKQSMSSLVGVLSGFLIIIVSVVLYIFLGDALELNILLILHILILLLFGALSYLYLMKTGPKKYQNLSV